MQYDHLVLVIFSYSILLAAVIGYFRYSKIPAGDRPFLFLIWIGLINEIVSEMTTAVFKNTAFNSNIYVLIESLLYCQLFLNWGSFKRNLNLFWATIVFLVVTWIYDNLFAHSIAHINSFFRIVSSFVLVFLAIDQVNKLITEERGRLFRNYRFLICLGMILFFTYRAYVEVFYWQDLHVSILFYRNIYNIMIFMNLFVNLMYALAILWIPTRQRFTLPS
jgi:hypothetical protein